MSNHELRAIACSSELPSLYIVTVYMVLLWAVLVVGTAFQSVPHTWHTAGWDQNHHKHWKSSFSCHLFCRNCSLLAMLLAIS